MVKLASKSESVPWLREIERKTGEIGRRQMERRDWGEGDSEETDGK